MGDVYSYFPAWAPGYPVKREDCYQYGFSYKDSGGQFRSGNFYTCNNNYCHHENYRMTSGSANWYCGQIGDHCPQTYSGTAHYDPDVSNTSGWFGSKHKHPRAYPMGSEIKQCYSRDQYAWRWDAYQSNVQLTIATLQGGLDSIYPVLVTCGPYNTGGVFIQEVATGICLNFTPGADGTISAPSLYGVGASYSAVSRGMMQNPDGRRACGGEPYGLVDVDRTTGRQWASGFADGGAVAYLTGNANTWKSGAAVPPYQGDCLQTGAQKFTDASDWIGKALLPVGWHGDAADSYRDLAARLQQAVQDLVGADKAVRQQIITNAQDVSTLQSSLYTQIVKCNDALPVCLLSAQSDFNGEGILNAPSDGSAGYNQAVTTVSGATNATLQAQATYIAAMTSAAGQVSTSSGQYVMAQTGASEVSAACDSDFGSELFLENVTGPGTLSSWTAVTASGNASNFGKDFQSGWSSQSSLGDLTGVTGVGDLTGGAGVAASTTGLAGQVSKTSSRSAASTGGSAMPVGSMAAQQGQQGSTSASAEELADPAPGAPESAGAAPGGGGTGSVPVDAVPAVSGAEQQASPESAPDGADDDEGLGPVPDDADDQGVGTAMVGDGLADSGPQQQQRPLQTSI